MLQNEYLLAVRYEYLLLGCIGLDTAVSREWALQSLTCMPTYLCVWTYLSQVKYRPTIRADTKSEKGVDKQLLGKLVKIVSRGVLPRHSFFLDLIENVI